MNPGEVVTFWTEAGPKHWFAKKAVFDDQIRERFEAWHHAAARRELDAWAGTAQGALGLLLLLDQFPRNMWRGSAHAFATDPLARQFASQAVDAGFDRQVDEALTSFFHLPFEHSEDLADQDRSCALAEAGGDADLVKWANIHRDVIRRFGRFPHRNAVSVARPRKMKPNSCDRAALRASHGLPDGLCSPEWTGRKARLPG